MKNKLTPGEYQLWRDFLAVSVQTLEVLDHELQKANQVSLTDYEILNMLSQADGGRLRMSELAREVLVSRSRLTYRIDRLVEVGYVEREVVQDDRRGLWAILTETGESALEAARGQHQGDIKTLFIDGIEADELETLGRVFDRLAQKLSSER